jgi:hypothetical protein
MTDQEDTRATEPASPDRAATVASESGREDDRNEQAAGSPAPDPAETAGDADDVPEAD